jgi:ABC-2 type transport system permease protein
MNYRGIWAIYKFEMKRSIRTLGQSLISPVLSTSLYFIVFGAAIGSNIKNIDGIDYAAFIVPGLIMLTILSQSIANASFGIYFPRFLGTIYEILSAPLSFFEAATGYIGASVTKSLVIATIVLLSASFFVSIEILHPYWMIFFLIMTCITFSLIGFIIGLWAEGFEKLQVIPLLVITPLTFLGGCFYSIHMLPPFWRSASLFNPVVYLVSGFRWSFYEISDVSFEISVLMIFVFMILSLGIIVWIVKSNNKLRS